MEINLKKKYLGGEKQKVCFFPESYLLLGSEFISVESISNGAFWREVMNSHIETIPLK